MRQRWMRRVAVILVLCLLFNDNLTGVFLKTQAVEQEEPVALFDVSGNDVVSSGDIVVEETEETSEEIPPGEMEETVEEVPSEETEEPTEEILVEETEELTEEVTEDLPALAAASDATLPSTLSDYKKALNSGRTEFYISTADDFIDAQTLCEEADVNGFAGITLIVSNPQSGDIWDIASISGFQGIGLTRPFKGTLTCYFKNGNGIQFILDKPIIANMGDGASMKQMDIICDGSSSAIAQNISGSVTLSDLWIQGTIGNGSGTVGLFASTMESGSSVTISNSKLPDGALVISGAIAGGFAGAAGDNVTVTWNSSADFNDYGYNTVTGTVAAGGCFGTVKGNYTYNVASQSYYPVQVSGAGAFGQVAGTFIDANGNGTLTIAGGNKLTVNLSGIGDSSICGGLVGHLQNATQIVVPNGGLTISGSMDGNANTCGGVAGTIGGADTQVVLELKNFTIDMDVKGDWAVGGLVGHLGWGKYIIKDVNISGKVSGGATGGLIGGMDCVAVELGEDIVISQEPTGRENTGLLVGERYQQCLIYLANTGVISNTIDTNVTGLEEIGGGGNVFRNHAISDGVLIGNGSLDGVGIVNGRVSTSGGWYQLKSAADFECLSIVLSTRGCHGCEAFGKSNFSDADYQLIRSGNYEVTNNVDISYENTGIVTMDCHFIDTANAENEGDYGFAGNMRGSKNGITITQNSSRKVQKIGLFSTLSGNNTFSKLIFAGTVTNAAGVGGIAYQTFGTGLTLENITMQKEFSNNTGIIGGVLAVESGASEFTLTAEDITLASTIDGGTVNTYSGFVTELDTATVDISNVTLGGYITGAVTGEVGGFLGRTWTWMGGNIQNVTVLPGTVYESSGTFGGLLTVITTDDETPKRLRLDTVSLAGLTVNVLDAHKCCGLLVQSGEKAIIEVIDYESKGCIVNNPDEYFDEVVGRTEESDYEEGFPQNSGIVSIHKSGTYFPEYHYENQVESLKGATNKYTTYFYDVFQYIENEDGTVNTDTKIMREDGMYYLLDTPEKMLIWNVVQLADSDVRKTFIPYFDNSGRIPDREDQLTSSDRYKIVGTVDVSGISFYPIPKVQQAIFSCSDDAKVIFGATEEMEEWGMSNVEEGSQHYGLQAGLFYNECPTLNITVSDLTLSGTIANMGTQSGGLIVGNTGVSGEGLFTNITMDDLRIAGYNGEPGAGLLISRIPDNKVTFENIQMINYRARTKAASALIGSAGSDTAANLTLRFTKMKIADDVNGGSRHNGDAFAHASLLYSYNYTDDAEINTGSGIYLFSEADAKNDIVTYGNELTGDTEFSDTSNGVLSTMGISAANYIPYVYTGKKIEVNPKTGDILKGCGTYEDPYIIEDAKQFLTLYRYINEKGTQGNYQYESFYSSGNGWKVIKPGTDADTDFCSSKHEVIWNSETSSYEGSAEHVEDVVTFGKDGFPTPEELSRAYYQLGADIDLSAVAGDTYKTIAEEFVGFGTDTRPFVGVWYGAGYTVTLPDKTDKTYTNYGFIQYAQGAVVKDITIKAASAQLANAPNITGATGAVIAVVLGGDNIIDNVTVEMALNVADKNVPAGGYVGVVKKGGLILRNVQTADLSNCKFSQSYSATGVVGAIVGKVEDGFVLYEGGGSTSPVWQGITAVNGYAAVPGYSILNADALEKSALSVNMIENTNENCTFVFQIPDAAGLQIMSMALNAEALNTRPSNHWSYTNYGGYSCGYSERARCRKAQYNTIGTTTQTNDYMAAAQYDNVMGYNYEAKMAFAYPYLYDLMGITGDDYRNYLVWEQYVFLNPTIELEEGKKYLATWELAENSEYDMSQFGDAFRGIGALYQLSANYSGTFHGTFDGNNSSIHLGMTRKVLSTETTVASIGRVGLFNTIWGTAEDTFEIRDLKISGTLSGTSLGRVQAGGLVAYLTGGNYIIENVGVAAGDTLTIKDYVNSAGGLIGEINSATNVEIANCYLNGTGENANVIAVTMNGGGLIGYVGTTPLSLLNNEVSYLQLSSTSGSGNIGGLIGFASGGNIYIAGAEGNPSIVSGSTITGGGSAAGFVGRNDADEIIIEYVECADCTIGNVYNVENVGGIIGFNHRSATISHGECSGLLLKAYANVGGVVGSNIGSTRTTLISDMIVRDIEIEETDAYNGSPEGLGGVVGKNEHYLNLENVQVVGSIEEGTYSCQIKGTSQTRNAHQGVGGLVGYHLYAQNAVTLKNCTVDSVQIGTVIGSGDGFHIVAGGLVGYVGSPVVIDTTGNCTCRNLNITVPLKKDFATGGVMAAAGGFGYIGYQDSSLYGSVNCGTDNDAYTALNVTGNTISGMYAGGLIGCNDMATFNLKGLQIADNTITSDTMAGGFVGYLKPYYSDSPISLGEAKGKEGYTHAENVMLERNVVTATSAGGFAGVYEADTTLEASIYDVTLANNVIAAEITTDVVNENPAVGGLFGRTVGNSAKGNAPLHCDGIFIQNTNQIGVKKNGSSQVQLVQTDGQSYDIANVEMPKGSAEIANDYSAIEAMEQEFGCFVGAFVGVWESSNIQMYVTDSVEKNGVFVFPVMASNSPVVDVGRKPEQSVDAYRAYCHVIYGASNSIAASESAHLGEMKAQVDAVNTAYAETESLTELLTGLRASKETMDTFILSYRDNYQFPGTELTIDFPMLVYRVQNGTLQEIMENVTDVMTNVAGNSASDMHILSIQCTPKLFDGTTFTTGTKASISTAITDGVATYTMVGYDGVTDNKLSYTEMTFTYNNNGRVKTFVIPVFVEEPILYSVHSKIMEGNVSDVSAIRQNGTSEENNNIIMANDSNYTLLLEYTYGEARRQMVDGVATDKMFYLKQNNDVKAWPNGTQLLLIDVSRGNKPYYYTVQGDGVEIIKFTDFKDSSGQNVYQNSSINSLPDENDEGQEYYTDLGNHLLTNTAVERYLLTVLSNDNDTESKVYSFHAGLSIADESLASRFQLEEDHKEETVWNIRAIPGLTVSLAGKGSDTDISGSISKTDGVTIKASLALQAPDIYWVERDQDGSTVIDSSNNSKYLELAFYLRDADGNRVALPSGTNVSYKLETGSYSGNRVVVDNSILYYYKDIKGPQTLENGELQISNISLSKIVQNTIVPIEYMLDFGGADLSTILDDSYVGWIELLRTGNPDYPMGNGNDVDRYSEPVDANAMQELGFALRADNMERLAINIYPEPSAQNTIPGHIMFDFSENLELAGSGAGKDLVLEKWSSLDYEVTYQIYRKTNEGYEPYTGDNIWMEATDSTGLVHIQSIENGEGNEGLKVTYRFTANQIETGNGDVPVEGVLSFPCEIKQNTSKLAEEEDSLTNYRLEATLRIKEADVTEEVSEKTTDFFVYTVTKLKTDL